MNKKPIYILLILPIVLTVSCKKDKKPLPEEPSVECRFTTGSIFVIKDNALDVSNLHAADESFSYDRGGRITEYTRMATTGYDEHYTLKYIYTGNEITETYTNEEYDEHFVQRYILDEKGRITKAVADEHEFGRVRTTTYKYDDRGYLVEKYIHLSDPNSGISEDRLTYLYDNDNLVQIDNYMSSDGQPGTTYTTTITYTDQPQQESFIYQQGYPVLHEQYSPLRTYFGQPSNNLISSIREFLGFGYANYRYKYELGERNYVKTIKKYTDTNQGQEFEISYDLQCE